MGLNLLRERYRVDLASLRATCEANYARLMRLLPGHARGAGLAPGRAERGSGCSAYLR